MTTIDRKAMWIGMGTVFGSILIFLIIVFATGSTFGQRCATVYEKDTDGYRLCVSELASGQRKDVSDIKGVE